MEQFTVKHYYEQAHPTIKGNGFDGLVIGEYREEAEAFIGFVNKLIAAQENQAAQTNNNRVMPCQSHVVGAWCYNKFDCHCGDKPCTLSARA